MRAFALARAAPGGSPVAIFRLSPFLGPRRRFKPAAAWRRHAQRHSYNSFLAIPNSFETAAKASPDSARHFAAWVLDAGRSLRPPSLPVPRGPAVEARIGEVRETGGPVRHV